MSKLGWLIAPTGCFSIYGYYLCRTTPLAAPPVCADTDASPLQAASPLFLQPLRKICRQLRPQHPRQHNRLIRIRSRLAQVYRRLLLKRLLPLPASHLFHQRRHTTPYYAQHLHSDNLGSPYIPDDSPVYPMVLRLYSSGYLDTASIGMRPWTRRSLLHILEKSTPDIMNSGNDQAIAILARLQSYISEEVPAEGFSRGAVYGSETLYTRLMGINGQSLRDSYHLGQTLVNDYGRPYEPGFNNITGFSTVNEWRRFSLYVRGEYQHSPTGAGYSYTMANQLSCGDEICPFAPPNDPQDTIPAGTQFSQNPFRLQEAYLSFHLLGHEISGGKSDYWTGPGYGGAMLWSNNAEDIYSFRINRIEPLHIPVFSRLFGTVRYDFFVGSLKGHTAPNSPWVHSETVSLRPTNNFEFAFSALQSGAAKATSPSLSIPSCEASSTSVTPKVILLPRTLHGTPATASATSLSPGAFPSSPTGPPSILTPSATTTSLSISAPPACRVPPRRLPLPHSPPAQTGLPHRRCQHRYLYAAQHGWSIYLL